MSRRPRTLARLSGLQRKIGARVGLCAAIGIGTALAPAAAHAWDPSTTAQAFLDAALRRSSLHVSWMEASQMQFGLYTPLRIDPARLDAQTRRWLTSAIQASHADIGATPRGGPGACPGAGAPTALVRNCVSGDLWELDALGWMRLGIVVEAQPRDRLLHHFVDLADPSAMTWTDSSGASPRQLKKGLSRAAGEPTAGRMAGTSFDGRHKSAVAFLQDPDEPLGPHAVAAHQRLAALAVDPGARAHHKAMALVATGATLRVVMDTGLPAYARSDATAFMQPLSSQTGDRGDAMVEYVRTHFGPRLPIEAIAPGSVRGGQVMADTLVAHVAGDAEAGVEGLATFSASHFVSAGTLPAARFVQASGNGGEALRTWLGGADLGLDPEELEGAMLSPWPAPRGYALNASGRPLFAFSRDEAGFTHAFVDEAVFADAAAHLLPQVVRYTASALDLMHTTVSPPRAVASGLIWQFELDAGQRDATLYVFHEANDGTRVAIAKVPLRSGESNRVVGIGPAPDGQQTVFVLDWTGADGIARAVEHRPGN